MSCRIVPNFIAVCPAALHLPLGLRAHLLHCADCRREWETHCRLNHVAQTLPQPAPPTALRNSVLAALPERVSPAPLTQRRRRTMNRTVFGTVVCGIGIAVMLVMTPRPARTNIVPARIRQALSEVNTWHLSGWVKHNGQKKSWNVWGQRAPYFYFEQAGDDIIWDDGKQQICLFTSRTSQGAKRVWLRRPSQANEQDGLRWSHSALVGRWNNADIKPASQTPEEAVFRFGSSGVFFGGGQDDFGYQVYHVDRQTALPTHYEIVMKKTGDDALRNPAKWNVAEWTATYNGTVPETLRVLPDAAQATQRYDYADAQTDADTENSITQNGATVKVNPLAVDKEGNILLFVQTQFGGKPIGIFNEGIKGDTQITVDTGADDWKQTLLRDDQGRIYADVRMISMRWNPRAELGQGRLRLLVPIDPLPPNAPLPRRIAVNLRTSLRADWAMSGPLACNNSLFDDTIKMEISLPPASGRIEERARQWVEPQSLRVKNDPFEWNMETMKWTDRVFFVCPVIDARKGMTPEIQKRMDCWENALRAMDNTSSLQMERVMVANEYANLQQWSRAKELLHAVLSDHRFEKPLPRPKGMPVSLYRQMVAGQLDMNRRAQSDARRMLARIANRGK